MDKQMIEEMADVMVKYALNIDGALPAIKSAMQDVGVKKAIKKVLWGYAGALYNAGYRKIPENVVVLTREEYEKLDKCRWNNKKVADILLRFEEVEGKIRKETAEKFAEMVSKAFIGLNCIDIDEWNWCQNKIDEICEEIIGEKNDK